MTDHQIIEKGKEVIRTERDAIAGLENSIDEQFVKAVQVIYNTKGRVVLTGVGKSGLIARKIVATLNSTGTPSIYMHPTDALHGDLGMVRKEDIVILISKSGNTEELVELIPMLKRLQVVLVAMVGNINSTIANECDILLNISVAEEACPHDLAPTSSTTATVVMGDALAVALVEKRGFTAEDFALLHPGGSLGKRLSLKISEIMYKGEDIPVVKLSTPINEAIYVITSKRLGTTAVVDDYGKLTGIITDGDLRRLLEKQLDIRGLKAEDVMTKNPKTIEKDFLASFALHKMEEFNITTILVAEEGKPVGIVHLHDLVKLGLQKR